MKEFDLPENWVWSSLGEASMPPQYGFTTKAANSGTIRFLRTTDITSGRLNWETVPFCKENPESKTKFRLRNGDIVISRAGSVGYSFLIKNPPNAVFASYLIRFNPLICGQYYLYFLKSPYYWSEISDSKIGIAVGNVNAKKLSDIPIPLPPLAEQKRIVAKIEELFSELDAGVESLRQAQAQLGVYRQALLKKAFSGKLTATWRQQNADKLEPAEVLINSLQSKKERPVVASTSRMHNVEHWSWATLDQLTEYITSGSRGWAEFYSDSGSVFIRAQNLNRDRLDISDIAYVSLPTKAEGKRTKVRKGDLLITITGANVTKAGIVDLDFDDAYVSQHVALCRILDTRLSEYVFRYVVAQGGGRKDLEELAYGAGKPGLNLNNLRSLEIPIPPVGEIPEIVRILDEQFEAIEQNEREIDAALERSEALRQSILKKAFSGQLVPQDPNDEPASALLERIRAEREKAAALKPSKKRAGKNARKSRNSKSATTVQSELKL